MLELVLISILLIATGIIPGRILVEKLASKLDLSIEEKLAVSFGISYFIYYLIGFAGYLLNLNKTNFNLIVLLFIILACAVIFLAKKTHIEKEELKLVGYLLIAFSVVLAIQALLPIYNGGGWMGDWYEHYQRMQFWLNKYSPDFKFIDFYILPSRPPLFNIVTYFYQSFLGQDFWIFQVICSFINLVVLLPVYLILKNLLKVRFKYLFLIMAAILLLNPAFMRNLTYTWTRHLTNYYILLGVYFYIKGRKGLDFKYIYTAFALLSCGQLTHYSAVIYLVAILFDYLVITMLNFKKSFKALIITGIITIVILSGWYGWSLKAYGAKDTFQSNTTYMDMKDKTLFDNINRDWLNLRNSIVPYFIYPELQSVNGLFIQNSKEGFYYDTIMAFYSDSLTGNLTFSLTIFLISWLILKPLKFIKSLKENYKKQKYLNFIMQDKIFWAFFAIISFTVGIHVNPYQICGCMHVTHQPLMILLICVAIKGLEQIKTKLLKALIICGIFIEGIIVTGSQVIFKIPEDFSEMIYSRIFYGNYYYKVSNKLNFMYDKFADMKLIFDFYILGIMALTAFLLFNIALKQNEPALSNQKPGPKKKP